MSKIKISKEDFVANLLLIQKGLEKSENFDKAMSDFTDSYFVNSIGVDWLTASTNLLSLSVGDTDDGHGTMIEWFLYEDVDKKIYLSPNSKYNKTDKEIEIDVSTPELLYDYFVKYGE